MYQRALHSGLCGRGVLVYATRMDEPMEPQRTLVQCAGEVLAEWRREAGITLVDLAAESGYSRSSLTDLEKGRRHDLLVSSLDALCAVYGRDVLDVLHEAQQRQYEEE